MESNRIQDSAAAARQARFGRLPARIRVEDMVMETPSESQNPAAGQYSAEASWVSSSFGVLDLGL